MFSYVILAAAVPAAEENLLAVFQSFLGSKSQMRVQLCSGQANDLASQGYSNVFNSRSFEWPLR